MSLRGGAYLDMLVREEVTPPEAISTSGKLTLTARWAGDCFGGSDSLAYQSYHCGIPLAMTSSSFCADPIQKDINYF